MQRPWRARLGDVSTNGGRAAVDAVIPGGFLMMLLGILECGYDWYVKHAITNASRDGARYGVMYRTDPANPHNQIATSTLTAPHRIQDVEDNYLKQVLPTGSTGKVTCTGDGYTSESGTYPDNTKVPLITTKKWTALGSMIPQLQDMPVTAQTVMLRE